ncbi:factor-independent urate hydroxylase [Sporosarcina sp. FSL K6-1522]|uniref:factor-independent urate hydroxylase n=1 Tax=Sporosarcina sp. FSL K6-1522 TaxID=2921554 RepID=UPI00315AE050
MTNQNEKRTMYYGKGDVFVYRTFVKPLTGLKRIPESNFTERDNTIFGFNCQVSLKGDAFLPSFTEGDNSLVVATDSMKNFIQRNAATYQGNTAEGFIKYICEAFLARYSHIESVELTANEISFDNVQVPKGDGHENSEVVYRRSRNESATTTIEVQRTATGSEVTKHSSGIVGVQLIKIKGSSFYGFIRDEYTTLPEAHDRPLFIYLDFNWEYTNIEDASGVNPEKYVAAEQICDIANTVFHELDNRSIQQLIYHIGLRILERFPQLDNVQFKTNNRTWETVVEEIPNSEGSVYQEPRPPFGFQGFIVTQEDLKKKATADAVVSAVQ